MEEIKYKQYVIVPKRPRMSKGKIASQVAHATFMALEKQYEEIDCLGSKVRYDKGGLQQKWKESGMCVIVLQCKNELELLGIDKYLEQWKISHHLYIDEGITEVNMGTPTALATGVIPEDKHWIFGTMKPFK